jgi:tRNA threonylcarbamoyladenosine biosynthesis protein TsaB
MLLAIDTATRHMGLALHDGETLIAEQTWRIGRQHNELLAPSVQHMLDVCDITMDDLRVLAVATGPGSYTGLRIGIALAKGMAASRKLPLVGVSTLDALAVGQPFENTRYRLLAVVQAGRGRVVVCEYRVQKGRWQSVSEPERLTWDELLTDERLTESYYITGEIDETGRESIVTARAEGLSLTLVSAAHRLRRAGFLAQEAWRRYLRADEGDFAPDKVAPVYLTTP